ncbi:MAG: 16S rRNA (adenine(1518)-N(6)/adenine(1519)-N(6))-dimethyltransferase RsmA [Holosporaceae bacterium]|jgi:16S rRNA (adenine1518-N6/adenine1519-N6)-dimethyltransferase|nr:16S rRNA (adenine(1518)-N(6)/adenine(1519)-N(6))-dimethyltransferase RsmA [Holosporaceae bacterium]
MTEHINLLDLSPKKIFDAFPSKIEKKFGQNFLFDEKINRRIISVAGDLAGKTVAEVGPGPGGLTLEILKRGVKKLFVVEFDPHWSAVWRSLSSTFDGKLEVIEEDALKVDFKALAPNAIISNLPYNISAQLLVKWLRNSDAYEQFVLMFQKEVADRLYASPSTKAYGRLSVLTQCNATVAKAFDVEPGSFFPPPKVRSTVVKLIPKTDRAICDFNAFSDLLTAAFANRRKTVVKSLSKFFQDPERILSDLGYSPNARAEEISAEDYERMGVLATS